MLKKKPVCVVVSIPQVAVMGERSVVSPPTGITPVQQMLASGTGALLTSLFGEQLSSVPLA